MNWYKTIGLAMCAVLVGLFSYFASYNVSSYTYAPIISAALCVALVCFIIFRCMKALHRQWTGGGDGDAPIRLFEDERRIPIWALIIILILSRVLVYVLAWLINRYLGHSGSFFSMWVRSDAPHYLGLAQNGYVTEGDPRFHIVFLPFYPGMIKLFWYAIQDYFVSGLAVSNIAAICAGVAAYKLALLDMDGRAALRSVKYLFILPAAIFFSAPMTESLFLLLSLLCIYCIRVNRWLLGCLMGLLAAFTRSLGVLLIVPAFIEYVTVLLEDRRAGDLRHYGWRALGKFLCLLLIPAGTGLYLLLNYRITGNALQFMVYQREHWTQQFCFFGQTLMYMTQNAIDWTTGNIPQFEGISLPNLIYIFGSLAVMIPAAKKMRASYTAYFLVYFAVAVGVTWLLSAPRYLTCAFPIAFALGQISEKKSVDVLLTLLLGAGFLAYLYMYLIDMPVY